jgi:hypothetical protein
MKVARSSAQSTCHLYPQEIFLVLISVKRLSRPQAHSATGRIMSMKNSNDTIRNQSHDLPVCSAVPQPLRAPGWGVDVWEIILKLIIACGLPVGALLCPRVTDIFHKQSLICIGPVCNHRAHLYCIWLIWFWKGKWTELRNSGKFLQHKKNT